MLQCINAGNTLRLIDSMLTIYQPRSGRGRFAPEKGVIAAPPPTTEQHLKPRFVLDADDVRAALEAAQAEAQKNQWVVSIAVVDAGAHLLGFLRMTNATPMSAGISQEKARTAALSGRESKFYEDVVKGGRVSFLSVPNVIALEGGVPVIVDEHCVAAIGVSGVKSDEDAQIARAGVKAILARR